MTRPDTEKLFVCYKGKWRLRIVPRNALGSVAMLAWLAGLAGPIGLFVWAMGKHPTSTQAAALVVCFVLFMLVWCGAMTAWAYARSEIVDLDEALRQGAAQDQDASDDGAWFASKALGFGSGKPIAWQGWALVGGHAALVILGPRLLGALGLKQAILAFVLGLLPLPLYRAKTRGGWGWRRGE